MEQKIRVSPAFGAMLCFLGWINPKYTCYFMIAIVLHELFHCLVAWMCNVRIEQICLRVCGAVIQTGQMNYLQEILIAAAGPAASIASGIVFLHNNPVFFSISMILAIMNLLPIYPMDGGRILRAFLLLRIRAAAVSLVMRVSVYIVCSLLMITACWLTVVCQAGIWPIFAALVLLIRVGEASFNT